MATAGKAYALLNLLIRHSRGMTVTELADEMNLSWRQTYRYISDLSLEFPVMRESDNRFRLMGRFQWTE